MIKTLSNKTLTPKLKLTLLSFGFLLCVINVLTKSYFNVVIGLIILYIATFEKIVIITSEGLIINIKAFMTRSENKVEYKDLTELIIEKNSKKKGSDKSLVTIHFVEGCAARKIIVNESNIIQIKKWAQEKKIVIRELN